MLVILFLRLPVSVLDCRSVAAVGQAERLYSGRRWSNGQAK
eukprot:gene26856-biopygen17442